MPLKSELVELYRTANSTEAQIVCNELQDGGIPAKILGAGRDMRVLPIGESTVSVYVNHEDAHRAREMIEALELSLPEIATHPMQFGLKDLAILQLLAAVFFALLAIFRPEFRVAYVALCGFFGGWLFVSAWMGIRKRKAER